MPEVLPGNLTGLYYISLGNLPWNLTWRQLKDFARNRQPDGSCIAIEHAHVYADQTGGWVSVRGKEHYLRAMDHLSYAEIGGQRNGRVLLPHCVNETSSFMLRSDNDSSPSSTGNRLQQQQPTAATSPFPLPTQAQHLQPNSMPHTQMVQQHPTEPSLGPQNFNNWLLPQPAANYAPLSPTCSDSFYQLPSPHSTSNTSFDGLIPSEYTTYHSPALMFPSNLATSLLVRPFSSPVYMVPQQLPLSYQQQHQHQHQPSPISMPSPVGAGYTPRTSPPSTSIPTPAPPSQTVRTIRTEARKIVIKGLPLHTTQHELQELLSRVSSTPSASSSSSPCSRHHQRSPKGTTHYHLQTLEMAKHSDGRPKGLAFAVFESHYTAKKAIEYLNSRTWQNKQLTARFAKEGYVEPSRGCPPANRTRHQTPSCASASRENSSFRGDQRGRGGATAAERRRLVDGQGHDPRDGGEDGKGEPGTQEQQQQQPPPAADADFDARFSSLDIGIDYRDGAAPSSSSPSASSSSSLCSAASSSARDHSVPSLGSLSSEGEKERGRRMRGNDVRRNTPLVVDGSSPGKRHR
ncbi:hypothetical protein LZ554_006366 [Drepanopeziza brunnea f. sp. 'monogermtubi']|nr:hypothetical protein LZ554_006366 [Drepanopeziza brunnea f. sp. 'monogermtubi']